VDHQDNQDRAHLVEDLLREVTKDLIQAQIELIKEDSINQDQD